MPRDIEQLTIVKRLRKEPAFELLSVRVQRGREPPLACILRRVDPTAPDPHAERMLDASAKIANAVGHPTVLPCHGFIEHRGVRGQLFDDQGQVSLETALAAAAALNRPPRVVLVVWIARQIADALIHAHSRGVHHGEVLARHVWLTREGAVLLDFGVCRPAAESFTGDVRALAGIVLQMSSELSARGATTMRDVPQSLLDVAERGLSAPASVRTFADLLARIFYVELDGDDELEGRRALSEWVDLVLPRNVRVPATTLRDSSPPDAIYADALDARNTPVMPVDLGPDDNATSREAADDPLAAMPLPRATVLPFDSQLGEALAAMREARLGTTVEMPEPPQPQTRAPLISRVAAGAAMREPAPMTLGETDTHPPAPAETLLPRVRDARPSPFWLGFLAGVLFCVLALLLLSRLL